MGLDMYLTYQYNTTEPIDRDLCYWRKQNAVHRWFVMNVQGGKDDCASYVVNKDHLDRLLYACRMVVNNWDTEMSHEFAEYFLPTTTGFFFGSTDYDEWYFQGLLHTISTIETFFADMMDVVDLTNVTIHYRSCW